MTGVGWWNADTDGVTGTLGAREYKDTYHVVVSALTSSAVRRLTPVECERLQGFPDGWTAQRVEQSGRRVGQVADQPDSARYRQMGNAVTVNVFTWVMRRLAAVDGGGAS